MDDKVKVDNNCRFFTGLLFTERVPAGIDVDSAVSS